jgi:hypothetical protein
MSLSKLRAPVSLPVNCRLVMILDPSGGGKGCEFSLVTHAFVTNAHAMLVQCDIVYDIEQIVAIVKQIKKLCEVTVRFAAFAEDEQWKKQMEEAWNHVE